MELTLKTIKLHGDSYNYWIEQKLNWTEAQSPFL